MDKEQFVEIMESYISIFEVADAENLINLYYQKFEKYSVEHFKEIFNLLLETYKYKRFPSVADLKEAEKQLETLKKQERIKENQFNTSEEPKIDKNINAISDFSLYSWQELQTEAKRIMQEFDFSKTELNETFICVIFYRLCYKILIPIFFTKNKNRISYSKEIKIKLTEKE